MVYCSKCAYQNFCYVGIKDYCPSYTPAMIAYDKKFADLIVFNDQPQRQLKSLDVHEDT